MGNLSLVINLKALSAKRSNATNLFLSEEGRSKGFKRKTKQ